MDWIANIESWDQKIILFINGLNHPVLDQFMWAVSDSLFGVPFYLIFIFFIFKTYSLKKTLFLDFDTRHRLLAVQPILRLASP